MHATQLRSESAVVLTTHASKRMCGRRMSMTEVDFVLSYGRCTHVRGADIYALGRREAARLKAKGIDASALQGIQVVCSTDGAVLTVYRNNDFRGLKPNRRHTHRRIAV